MKRFVIISVLVLAQGTAFAAVDSKPVPGKGVPRTPTGKLQLKFRHQLAQIQMETKRGKLTAAQAKTIKAQVEAVRQQEIADLKENGSKTLTPTQVAELDKQLDGLSKSIPVK